jgi:hypothetical protein
MGLDTSHDCWHGAYSAFGRWRQKVAEAAGYAVWAVKYDDSSVTYDTVMIDWGHLPENALMGEWPETPADPLLVLIAHSDCDGEIRPEQAGPLADRLEELLPALERTDAEEGAFGHIAARGGYAGAARKFIDGLRAAVAADEPVDFH